MHPYRYDGSPGPYQALLERLATMGEAHEPGAGDHRPAMPGWRDPFPFMGDGQLDAHLVDLQKMAERDQPTLHDADDLTKTMGAHAIVGASSTMHSLNSRQHALEIIAQRAEWLAGYLTPERLDAAEAWRDQKAQHSAQAFTAGSHRVKAQNAMSNLRLAIHHSYTDTHAALAAWDDLVADPASGGLQGAAKAVMADPSILGKLEGGKTWFGLGAEDHDRVRARDRLADLSHNATQFLHHDKLAGQAARVLRGMEAVGQPDAEVSETLAAMRDVRRIDLHYMANLQNKLVEAQALIAARATDPIATLAASQQRYQEWRDTENPGERITATQLKKAMAVTIHQVRQDPALTQALAAKGLKADKLFGEPITSPRPAPKQAAPAP